jgi:hypothetical protein
VNCFNVIPCKHDNIPCFQAISALPLPFQPSQIHQQIRNVDKTKFPRVALPDQDQNRPNDKRADKYRKELFRHLVGKLHNSLDDQSKKIKQSFEFFSPITEKLIKNTKFSHNFYENRNFWCKFF